MDELVDYLVGEIQSNLDDLVNNKYTYYTEAQRLGIHAKVGAAAWKLHELGLTIKVTVVRSEK